MPPPPLQNDLDDLFAAATAEASKINMMFRPERNDARWLAYRAMLNGKSWKECAMISGRTAQLMPDMYPSL